jgi:hypothetical protein
MDKQDRLRRIMERDGLTYQDVADIVAQGKVDRVKAWLRDPDSASFRQIPETTLRLLDVTMGIRICPTFDDIVEVTGASVADIKEQVCNQLLTAIGRVHVDRFLAERVANGDEMIRFGKMILSDDWIFAPVIGPYGRCYAVVRGRVVPTHKGYRLDCEMIDAVYTRRIQDIERQDTALMSHVQDLLRQQRMHEEMHAQALLQGNKQKAMNIAQALDAMSSIWKQLKTNKEMR